MSAKQAYKRPEIHLPELPPELWSQILREATLEAVPLQPSSQWIWPRQSKSPFIYRQWKSAIVTKRYIVRVCRQWYALGIPFLHEHFMLSKFRHTASMMAVAQQIPSIHPSVGPLGAFTKRLDVTFNDNAEYDSVNGGLTALLQYLPSLISLVFDSPELLFEDVSSSYRLAYFFHSISRTLEYFDWGPDPDVFPFSQWLKFINDHPNLRIVNGPSTEAYLDEDLGDKEPISKLAPPLKDLFQLGLAGYDASEFYSAHLPEDMPALRGIAIEWPPLLEDEIYRKIFARYGKNLVALYIEYEDDDDDDPEFQSDQPLGEMLQLCPRLEEVYISAWWSSEVKVNTPAKSVKVLGVRFTDRQLTSSHCKKMLKQLTKAKDWFPNLKVIRFFEEINLVHLRGQHLKRFEKGVSELLEGGILVENPEGRTIRPLGSLL